MAVVGPPAYSGLDVATLLHRRGHLLANPPGWPWSAIPYTGVAVVSHPSTPEWSSAHPAGWPTVATPLYTLYTQQGAMAGVPRVAQCYHHSSIEVQ